MPTKKYAALAKDYDIRWADYNAATIKHTLARLAVKDHMSVLDVGCGTGNMLATLAHEHPTLKLSGVEPTGPMLDLAREKFDADKVTLKRGYADRLPFDDSGFDAVICNSMFHYIPEPELFLQEALRVLKPGGQIIITDWCLDFLTSKINNIMLRLNKDSYTKIYKVRELTQLLMENGFSEVKGGKYKIDWYWGLMTLQAVKAK